MIINTASGATSRGLKPYTDRAAYAAFLDAIQVGQSVTLKRFIRKDGRDQELAMAQARLTITKAPGTKYTTRTTPDGLLITRLA